MDYCMLVNSVHVLALSIEPDFYKESEGGYAPHHVDRSQARIALINTAVIAATKGLLEIPAAILEPGDLHNPDGQDAPF
jgi:hypothetical protein